VFLELIDTKVALASSLVEGLDKMDHETPLPSVKKAGQKLGKVLQGPQPEPNARVKRDPLPLISILSYFITRLHLSRPCKILMNESFLSLPK
jgi:hypothetical protein